MKVVVIGAGLAGLTAAADLSAAGHDVVVFEKSRGCGGRTATRRGPGGLRFDHGAPFLHDADPPLAKADGLAEYTVFYPDGSGRVVAVGTGANNAPAKRLAYSIDVRTRVRVARLAPMGRGWTLFDETGSALGPADAVIVTAPAPQAAEVLRSVAPALADRAARAAFDPCWTVMAAWARPLDLPFTAAHDTGGLAWAIAESPKPGRAPGERWVLQASAAWSHEHLEDELSHVGAALRC